MRLTTDQIQTIISVTKHRFGKNAKVFLFGSRVDDSKKGGDIDLLISNKEKSHLTLKNKLLFLIDVKTRIGDQKIDLVYDTKEKYNNIFLNSIKQQSIELC